MYIFFIAIHFAYAEAIALTGQSGTYTVDKDFDSGKMINVGHQPSDQLQLVGQSKAFSFIWVAVSSKGTVVKIDTVTGKVLGEYHTAPRGRGLNPSRTTVDKNGNVWVTNRDESEMVRPNAIAPGIPIMPRQMGSLTHIGLVENGQCVDRNKNGVIDTSSGQNDVLPWTNEGRVDDLGGVSTAEDECILHYTRVNSYGTRHVSVTKDNHVWVSGTGGRFFDLLDGVTGKIIKQAGSVNHGGYGGLIDSRGVIWSTNPFLRWDTRLPLMGPPGMNWQALGPSYGVCIDSKGNVWTSVADRIYKYSPDGRVIGEFFHGSQLAQGCVVDQKDHVWIAHSMNSSTVGHIRNDGTYVGTIEVGDGPTGVAVDSVGKIWATNFNSRNVSRIDPKRGRIGADGVTTVGEVDFTSGDLGGNLYNYSDMTGSLLQGAPENGSWTVVHDSGLKNADWGRVTWTSKEPGDSVITVKVSSSEDGVNFGPFETAKREMDLTVQNGRYLKVEVFFKRSGQDGDKDGTKDTPILYDLSLMTDPCFRDKTCYDQSNIILKQRAVEIKDEPVGTEKEMKPPEKEEKPVKEMKPPEKVDKPVKEIKPPDKKEAVVEPPVEPKPPKETKPTDKKEAPVEPPKPKNNLKFIAKPASIDMGKVEKNAEAKDAVKLKDAAQIQGDVELLVSSDYERSGTKLELNTGQEWIPLGKTPKIVHISEGDNLNLPLRLRVGRCPEGSLPSEVFHIFFEGKDANAQVQKTETNFTVSVQYPGWFYCWRWLIALASGLMLTGILIHGFWIPSRFPERLGVVLSPEEDMAEGFFHPIRAQKGTGSGFYRDAKVYVCEDYRLAGSPTGAVACLRADSGQVRIKPIHGSGLLRQTIDGEWEEIPQDETTMRHGVIYKNHLGSLYFELRTG
jgi:streptogramin lyase